MTSEERTEALQRDVEFLGKKLDALCKHLNISMRYDFVRQRWEIAERGEEDKI